MVLRVVEGIQENGAMIGRGRKVRVCQKRCVETVSCRVLLIYHSRHCGKNEAELSATQSRAIGLKTRSNSPDRSIRTQGRVTPPLDPIQLFRSFTIRPIPLTPHRQSHRMLPPLERSNCPMMRDISSHTPPQILLYQQTRDWILCGWWRVARG